MDKVHVLEHAKQFYQDCIDLNPILYDDECDKRARELAFWYAYNNTFELDLMNEVQVLQVIGKLEMAIKVMGLHASTVEGKIEEYMPMFTEHIRKMAC